jgi:hypothetical protein
MVNIKSKKCKFENCLK